MKNGMSDQDRTSSQTTRPLTLWIKTIGACERSRNDWPDLRIQAYRDAADRDGWLRLMNDAFPRRTGTRPWSDGDFRRELTGRPWWQPDCLWLAREPGGPPPLATVAVEVAADRAWAQLHWLAVATACRRQGVGGWLIRHVEAWAYQSGVRELRAETLRVDPVANPFYRRQGFRADSTAAADD